MALLQIEGFDGISTTADMSAKGYSVTNTPTIGNTNPTPRTGTGRLQLTSTNVLSIPFSSTSTVYCGFGIYIGGTPTLLTNGSQNSTISFGNGNTGTYGDQVWFTFDASGYLKVYQYDASLLGTSSIPIPLNSWQYLEIYVKASLTVGEITVKLNNSSILTLTNKVTITYGSDIFYNSLILRSAWNHIATNYDDLYIDNTAFHGDCKVEILFPNAAGNYTQFTPSTGSNYTCVDEAVPNDADYVEGLTVGNKDSYNFDALSANNIVEGLQLNIRAEKTDAGAKEIRGFTRVASTDYNGNTLALSDGSYLYNKKIWEVNPNTSTAWTKSTIDSAEFGVEITV